MYLKHNPTREILLMIINGKKRHYLALKNLCTALFRGITSKNNEHFYFLNRLYSLRTKKALKEHRAVCKN